MEKEQIPLPPPLPQEEEIDLLALAKKLCDGRKIILKSIIISGIFVLLVAIFTPNSYTSKTILVPQMNTDSKSSGLSGLAALAGINVGISQTSSEISPLIYPLIIKSIPFELEMMKTPFLFNVKEGFATLTVDMDEPVSAAQMT